MNTTLRRLYDASEEDMQFGIGTMMLGDQAVPVIQITYADWPREKLDLVRESLNAGITFAAHPRPDGKVDMRLETRERIDIQLEESGETSVLRGPAWSADLPGIDKQVMRQFEAERAKLGGYLLAITGADREVVIAENLATSDAVLGSVMRHHYATPP